MPKPDAVDYSEALIDFGNDQQKARAARLKQRADALMEAILSFGSSHELRLARDSVEVAVMWATKHLQK